MFDAAGAKAIFKIGPSTGKAFQKIGQVPDMKPNRYRGDMPPANRDGPSIFMQEPLSGSNAPHIIWPILH
jgi:hypothetical protein